MEERRGKVSGWVGGWIHTVDEAADGGKASTGEDHVGAAARGRVRSVPPLEHGAVWEGVGGWVDEKEIKEEEEEEKKEKVGGWVGWTSYP